MNNNALADHTIEINDLKISNRRPLTLISGPCQLESLEHSMIIAEKLIEISLNHLSTKPTVHHISPSAVLE